MDKEMSLKNRDRLIQLGITISTFRKYRGLSLNTPGWNRQYDRASPTPLPLKSYTLSAGPTPSV